MIRVIPPFEKHNRRYDAFGGHFRFLFSTANRTHYIHVTRHRNNAGFFSSLLKCAAFEFCLVCLTLFVYFRRVARQTHGRVDVSPYPRCAIFTGGTENNVKTPRRNQRLQVRLAVPMMPRIQILAGLQRLKFHMDRRYDSWIKYLRYRYWNNLTLKKQ